MTITYDKENNEYVMEDPITFKQDLVAMLAIAILVPSFGWALITAPLVVAATLATNWTVGLYIFFHLKRKGQVKAEVEERWRIVDAATQDAAQKKEDGEGRDKEILDGLIDDGYGELVTSGPLVDDNDLVFACDEDDLRKDLELLEDLTEDK